MHRALLFLLAASAATHAQIAIAPDALQAHVRFLASDLLEGRGTPSKGQEIAAEYVAAQFSRLGLRPGNGDSWFQPVKLVRRQPDLSQARVTVQAGARQLEFRGPEVRSGFLAALEIASAPLLRADLFDTAALDKLTPEAAAGSILFVDFSAAASPERQTEFRKATAAFRPVIERLKPAAILYVRPEPPPAQPVSVVVSPEHTPPPSGPRSITIYSTELHKLWTDVSAGRPELRAAIRFGAPIDETVQARNVAAILRGSDAALQDSWVILSAHFDHLPPAPSGSGDRIYNGANDNASGVAALLEIAAALRHNPPKRSVLFAAFTAEEIGLLGARYYAAHPLVPLAATAANINLECLGVPTEGGTLKITGLDLTDLAAAVATQAKEAGIAVTADLARSARFFRMSDNAALADKGVPAITVAGAFEFPTLHQPGDEWPTLDYKVYASFVGVVARAIVAVSNSTTAPSWRENSPAAERYLRAWRELQAAKAR